MEFLMVLCGVVSTLLEIPYIVVVVIVIVLVFRSRLDRVNFVGGGTT